MREIKFRGQDSVNKKWLYGNLEIPLINQNKSKHYIVGHSYGQYQRHEVEPETVGQYTGLKDKKGKEIFEGDILIGSAKVPCSVSWDEMNACFAALSKTKKIYILSSEYKKREVIGNIYENPELLEGDK